MFFIVQDDACRHLGPMSGMLWLVWIALFSAQFFPAMSWLRKRAHDGGMAAEVGGPEAVTQRRKLVRRTAGSQVSAL